MEEKIKYITLRDLGSSGGLCSQLQIFAGLKAVAKSNNLKIAFSQEMIDGNSIIYPHTGETVQTYIRIFDLLDLEYELKPQQFFNDFKDKHINFHTTTYDETLFNLEQGFNYNLIGRFDLYTYWYNDIKDEIEKWKFKTNLKISADKRLNIIKGDFGNDNPIVSIHMRRGDYLLPQFPYCELTSDYYLQSITQNFSPIKDYNFLVFSNDIEFSKSILEGDNIQFIDPLGGDKVCTDSEKEDLILLSLCDHHITANSSYSWWGAFLSKNKNKRIICPTNFTKPEHQSSWMNGRYYPPNWINIDNKN